MSRSTNSQMNKYQNQSKVHPRQYLYNIDEPGDNYDFHISPKLEFMMLEDINSTKIRIRHDALLMRNYR